MAGTTTVPVPDIGDFDDVPVVEVLVAAGDTVAKEDSLVVLESEKATMEIPSPAAGKVVKVMVKVGDRVKEGSELVKLEVEATDDADDGADDASASSPSPSAPLRDPSPRGEDRASSSLAPAGAAAGDSDDAPASDAANAAGTGSGDAAADGEGGSGGTGSGAAAAEEAEGAGGSGSEAGAAADAPRSGSREATEERSGAEGGVRPADATGGGTAADGPQAREEVELPDADHQAQLVVLGSGPGGYTAAFRAADLGLDVLLIERYPTLGGVCLNVGCIPSKALLHTAKLITDAEASGAHGVTFAAPEIDLDALREFKDGVVDKLVSGLAGMAKQRKVRVVHGVAQFTGEHTMRVDSDDGAQSVAFQQCIIAAGSEAVALPDLPDDARIVDSTGALELRDIPERLLIVGGGIIGLEMATVYDALGSAVTVVEMADALIPGADPDLVRPLHERIKQRYAGIHLETRVEAVDAQDDGLHVRFAGKETPDTDTFDRMVVAVGRRPNGGAVSADAAGVEVDTRGFIPVDQRMRTNVEHISAIGDVVPGPALAHKALHEAKVAAEVIAGQDVTFDARTIPAVAYTDPEVAWMGLTEIEAKAQDVPHEVAAFPWSASGRALSMGRGEGVTKLLVDPDTRRVLGAGATGVHAGDLITEAVLALEMGAVAEDLALTVHPHPTLSETIGLAADLVEGTITDLPPPRKRK